MTSVVVTGYVYWWDVWHRFVIGLELTGTRSGSIGGSVRRWSRRYGMVLGWFAVVGWCRLDGWRSRYWQLCREQDAVNQELFRCVRSRVVLLSVLSTVSDVGVILTKGWVGGWQMISGCRTEQASLIYANDVREVRACADEVARCRAWIWLA